MSSVIYVRQSLDRDGKGAAVDRQLTECRDLAKRHDLTVSHEYVDNDVSATKGTRPAFTQLLSAIRNGTSDAGMVEFLPSEASTNATAEIPAAMMTRPSSLFRRAAATGDSWLIASRAGGGRCGGQSCCR